MIELILFLALVLLGAALGGILNVIEHRLPQIIAAKGMELKNNLVTHGAHCPACKTSIEWKHNLPVISYILLGGQCGTCKTNIPRQYLFNELAGVIAMAAPLLVFGFNKSAVTMGLSALLTFAFVSILVAACQGYRKRQHLPT